MNPFLLSSAERLKEWRDFRKHLLELSEFDQLSTTVSWWAQCPLSTRSIDPYNAKSWPDCWELMHCGDFCKSSIALGIEQTLIQTNGVWSADRIKLVLIDDNAEDIYLIVTIDDHYVINYDHGKINNINELNNFKILDKFKFDGKRHWSILTTPSNL